MDNLKHGSTTTYSHHGCRCDECRAAVAEYGRKRKAAMAAGTWVPNRNPRAGIVTPCVFPDCGKPMAGRGLCTGHYNQRYIHKIELRPLGKKRFMKDGQKACSRCEMVKPSEEFFIKSSGRKRRQSACKDCTGIASRAHRYGVSFDEMKALLDRPCEACGKVLEGKDRFVDHCHVSGKVRGLLCHKCNVVLMDGITPEILRRLADYLER